MSRLRQIWERTERIVIYLVLILLTLEQLSKTLLPDVITSPINPQVETFLNVFVLLLVFRYIDERLNTVSPLVAASPGFSDGVEAILKKKNVWQHIDIWAFTGSSYFVAVRDSGARIGELRLLLRSATKLEAIQFPTVQDAKEGVENDLKNTASRWQELVEDGRIGKLTIKYFPFDTVLHFMLADGRWALFGLFQPTHQQRAPKLRESYIIDASTPNGDELARDMQNEFDAVWDDDKFGAESGWRISH